MASASRPRRLIGRVHGAQQLGALRVTELPTSRATAHLQQMGSMTQAKRLRMIWPGCTGWLCAMTSSRLCNMRRSLRAALPADLSWMTPHSLRRTVATVVRDARGPAQAQQQLCHAKPATTEARYLQRQTRGPDVRAVLDEYAGGDSGD
jgi:integrase